MTVAGSCSGADVRAVDGGAKKGTIDDPYLPKL